MIEVNLTSFFILHIVAFDFEHKVGQVGKP